MFEGSNLVNVYFGQRPTCDNLVTEANVPNVKANELLASTGIVIEAHIP